MRQRPVALVRPGLTLVLAALWIAASAPARSQEVSFTPIASGFEFTTDIQHAPGSNVLFVTEQDGQIHVIENAAPRPTPMLDIRDRVSMTGELGLLGLAFDPAWPAMPYLYVHYARTQSGGSAPYETVIARYQADPATLIASPDSELILLATDQPSTAHNAGALVFDANGNLLVSLGDGNEAPSAQETTSLLGKLVRLNVRGTGIPLDCGEGAATLPADNPLVDGPGGSCDEVYAYGFRNPWRISYDAVTSTLWVADVGAGGWEEVNVLQSGGGNYGWPVMEGSQCVEVGCDTEGLILPVHEYGQPGGQAITGGYVHRRSNVLFGHYIFGDFVTGLVWALDPSAVATQIAALPGTLTTFGVDEIGNLYAALWVGAVYRMEVVGTATEPPPDLGVSLELAGPNPFLDNTAVRVVADEGGPASVVLLDVLGRRVATLYTGDLEAGATRELRIDGASLAPGSYVVALTVAGKSRYLRLAVADR